MTPETAVTILGLTGAETPDQIRAIYTAQAAALDARIAAAEGDARDRYRKDREDIELARLALLGSDARRETAPATATQEPKPEDAGPLEKTLTCLLGVALFAIPASITGWFIPLPQCTPGKSAAIAAVAGPTWALAGVMVAWVLDWIFRKLLGWTVGPLVLLIYFWLTHFASQGDKGVRTLEHVVLEICVTATMGVLGACVAIALVVGPILWTVAKVKGTPSAGGG